MIEQWNDLSTILQILLRGTGFLLLCWTLALLFKKASSSSQHRIWQAGILGTLIITLVAIAPPLWHIKVPAYPLPELAPAPSTAADSPPRKTPSIAVPQLVEPTHPHQTARLNSWDYKRTLLAVWAIGLGFLLLRWAVSFARIRTIIRQGNPAQADLQLTFQKCHQQLGLKRPAKLVTSTACPTPFVYGTINPVVVIPAGSESWAPETQRIIFLHELAHLRSKDTLFLWLGTLAKALHWPNPLIWMGASAWKEAAELTADEAVVRAGVTPTDYAETLCSFASQPVKQHLSLGLTMADSSTEMEQRIGRLLLLKNTKPTSTIMSKITTTLLAVGTLAIGGLAFSQEKATPTIPEKIAAKKITTITSKLESIIIPLIDFEDTTIDEAIDFLRARSRELDTTTTNESEKGINFVVRTPRKADNNSDHTGAARIDSLLLKNVPLQVAIQYISDKAKLRYKVDEFAVTLLPLATTKEEQELITRSFRLPKKFDPNNKETNITSKDWLIKQGVQMPKGATVNYLKKSQTLLVRNTGVNLELIEAIIEYLHNSNGQPTNKQNSVEQKLKSIPIPLLEMEDVTLRDAIDLLAYRAKELGAPELSFVITGKPDPSAKRIDSLFLKNIPLQIALQYVCDKTKTSYKAYPEVNLRGGPRKNMVIISPITD